MARDEWNHLVRTFTVPPPEQKGFLNMSKAELYGLWVQEGCPHGNGSILPNKLSLGTKRVETDEDFERVKPLVGLDNAILDIAYSESGSAYAVFPRFRDEEVAGLLGIRLIDTGNNNNE